mmetsp:Transcript_9341/g.21593  ORF Transcript_9341/g.21593 Transcript_9341/m.21593 type:complete len:348 (+) Transcript_9341:57-1100(+)
MSSELSKADAPTLVRYGLQLRQKGRIQEAAQIMQAACQKCPTLVSAQLNLGHLLSELDCAKPAREAYLRVLEVDTTGPTRFEAHLGLAALCQENGLHADATKHFEEVILAQALSGERLAECYYNLGNSYSELDCLHEAQIAYEASIEVDETADAQNNLGWLLFEVGDVLAAKKRFDSCCKLVPESRHFAQNRLMLLNYLSDADCSTVFEYHRKWGAEVVSSCQQFDHWPELPVVAKRRLRIGYISPDFRNHSTSFFVRCLAEHHSVDLFDVMFYSNSATEDEVTESIIQALGGRSKFRNLSSLSACDAADRIRSDRIDILVELAGHTASNRLDVMALKPAPLQFLWL